MRLCIVTQAFPVLSETFVLDHVRAMIERGHDVDVLAEGGPGVEDTWRQIGPNPVREHVTYDGRPRELLPRALQGARALVALAARHPTRAARALDVRRYGREAGSLRVLFAASAAGPRRSYDVIHSHFGPAGVKALALRDMGLVDGPLVAHFHGYDVSSYVRHFGHLTYRHLFREGDAFLAVSERMRARLIALGADAARIHVQRYPVDTRRLQPAQSPRPEGGPVKLLSVARLVEKKGLAYAIRGVARAVACGADVEYAIIGGGPLADDLKALTGELGMSKRITFHGALPHAEVLAAMRRCDVVVVPSVTATNGDEEGSPVTIIEAMALGLPVLSTWHSGIPETVRDTVTGLLVPEADDLALSNALVKLVRDPAMRARLGAAGRKAAEATLDRTNLYDQLERRYEALVAGGR